MFVCCDAFVGGYKNRYLEKLHLDGFNSTGMGFSSRNKVFLIKYFPRKPFFYFDQKENSFRGIEWEIVRMIAERKNIKFEIEECSNLDLCEK